MSRLKRPATPSPMERAAERRSTDLTARLSGLIGDLYETAIDAPRVQGVLDEVVALTGADNGGLSVVDMSTGQALFFVFSPIGVVTEEAVRGMFATLDPWRRALVAREPGKLYVDEEISLLHDLVLSEEYQRWLPISERRSRASGYLPLTDSQVMFFGLTRTASRRPFTRADVYPLELLLPHFGRASRINRIVNELTVMRDVAEDRYGQLGVGIVLANAERHVSYCSRTAKRILTMDAGLRVANGLLECSNPSDQQVLDGLIVSQSRLAERQGYVGGESMTLSVARDGESPLSILVSPYTNRLELRTVVSPVGRALVLLFDPSYRAPTREQALQQLYGMSESEAELAAALAAGQRLEEIAAERKLSKETLRSRLKRIFAKTGTRRQSELLRLLLASPALLEHRPAPRPLRQGKM